MTSRRWRWLTVATLMTAGCSSDGPLARPTTSSPPVSETAPRTAVSEVPAPEPTGVPGLTAADPFCSAWAGYAGTLQALGIAASFGDLSSDRFAALELVAAPHLVDDAARIDASWPAELADERSAVMDQRVGPYARRAQRAVDALTDAGVTTPELATLRSIWQAALAARDPEVPVIDVASVPEDLQEKIDAAARAFDDAVTPFAQDPSLVITGIASPNTDAYLVAHCPDLASSGVGDAL